MPSKQPYALAEIIAGQGSINAVSFKPGKIEITLSADEAVTLRIAQTHQPHSRAVALPQGHELVIQSDGIEGLISLEVPRGTTAVEITAVPTPAQRLGKTLGSLAVVLLVGTVLVYRGGKFAWNLRR